MDRVEVMLELRDDVRLSAAQCHESSPIPPSAALAMLFDGLTRRNATSRFLDDAVEREAVLRACEAARRIDRAVWATSAHHVPLRVLVAVRAVAGLDAGLFELAEGELDPAGVERAGLSIGDMVLQPEFADAAAIILVVGPLATALARYGAHGYQTLLVRAGAACEAAWLSAVRDGLSGSIFAGFLPSGLRDLAGVDGYNDTQLLALALGHPA